MSGHDHADSHAVFSEQGLDQTGLSRMPAADEYYRYTGRILRACAIADPNVERSICFWVFNWNATCFEPIAKVVPSRLHANTTAGSGNRSKGTSFSIPLCSQLSGLMFLVAYLIASQFIGISHCFSESVSEPDCFPVLLSEPIGVPELFSVSATCSEAS